jgi:hypothetical protein
MTDRALRVLEEIADVLGVDPTDIEQDVCWDDLPGLVYELDRRRVRSEHEVARLRFEADLARLRTVLEEETSDG